MKEKNDPASSVRKPSTIKTLFKNLLPEKKMEEAKQKSTSRKLLLPILWVSILVLLPLLIIIFGAIYFSSMLIRVKRSGLKKNPGDYNLKYDVVNYKSKDDHEITGWWLQGRLKSKAIILCHGFSSDKSDFIEHISFLHNAGYSLLLFDFRGHGDNQIKNTSLGYLETNDLLGSIEFTKKRGCKRIGILGFSMGASISIIASARSKDVDAIVSDSAFAKLTDIIKHYGLNYYNIPLNLFLKLIIWTAEIRTGYKYEHVNPVEDIKKLHVPLLIIHGEKDKFVPFAHAKTLFEAANEPKELVALLKAGHVEGHSMYKKTYEAAILRHFTKYL